MANQKVYNIVINGIKESINELDILISKLDNIENRLDALGKQGIKLDTKGLKDLEKIKIPEISIEGIDAKALKKEMQQLEKDIAKGAKTIDGEYTNTLNGLRAKLRDLKAELGTVDIDVDADVFADLTDEIKELNDQVKQMEQDYGTFARNVGNYTESVVDALNEFDSQMYETAGTIEEVKNGVDSLKGKQMFDVNIGGVAVQFENVSQAIGEIDDMAHSAAAKMQELRNAGKENTEEYKKLNQEFQEFIQTSANLERVRKQTDELRDSVASTSRGLDLGVQSFQALGNAMQMASGIAGLFGDNQEKIEEAINRTVQIQAILQAAQELYNQTTQKGTVLNTLYSATFGKISGGLSNMTTKLGLGTKAAKLFNNTLKANIFIAIATAILWVVTNLDKLSEMLGLTNEDTKVFTDLWNKISPVIMGVGRAITDWLINPIRTLTKTISKVLQGDWKGAFEEIGKGVKEQFNIIEDFQKGYADEVKAQAERATKKQKIELEKQLLHQKEFNEAKYGSDWKYTKDGIELYRKYFAAKLALYDKDSEEYRQALLEQISFERELKEHQEKEKNGGKSRSGKSKLEIQREIEDATIAAMKDGFDKRMAELKLQQKRELEDAGNNAKLKEALLKKHQKEENDLIKEHTDEVEALYKERNEKLYNLEQDITKLMLDNTLKSDDYNLDKYRRDLDTMLSSIREYQFQIPKINKDWFNIDTSSIKNFFTTLGTTIKDGWDVMIDNIRESRDGSKLVDALMVSFSDGIKTEELQLDEFVFGFGAIDGFDEKEKAIKQAHQTLVDLNVEHTADISLLEQNMQDTSSDALKRYYQQMIDLTKEANDRYSKVSEEYSGHFIGIVNERILTERKLERNNYNHSLKELEQWKDDAFEIEKKAEQKLLESAKSDEAKALRMAKGNAEVENILREKFANMRMQIMEKSNENLIEIEKRYESQKYALTLDYINKTRSIEVNGAEERNDIIAQYNDKLLQQYEKHFDSLISQYERFNNVSNLDLQDGNLQFIATFTQRGEALAKYGESFIAMAETIEEKQEKLNQQFADGIIDDEVYSISTQNLDLLRKQTHSVLNQMGVDWDRYNKEVIQKRKELNAQLKDGTIDQETYDKEIEKLENHRKELGNILTRIVKNFGDNWKEIAVNSAQLGAAVVGIFSQMYSQIADLQYQNEMYRIEKLQEEYDKETEILQDALEEQEELFEKHNQNVNDIEGELETARGDRRLFLLDQINAEMMKREQAWAQQQKIQKQQEQLEKKKEALEQRQKAAEQKRNKQNQKVQIAQATASTALAVTNALSVQPWFLGVALAAVAAAMGAVQIATIAKQKFADGGVIQGKSHSQGGVPVMNGSVEVEGGEYITNKVTTSKNVDVLTFINSKKKKLDLSDFVEFYSNGSNKNYSKPFKTVFAAGGTLPSMNAPMIDTRAINSIKSEDNRPIYVSVTEIENVQNKVRNVRAIAGLED